MNLSTIFQLSGMSQEIQQAVAVAEKYANDPEAKAAIDLVERIEADPAVKAAIATAEKVAAILTQGTKNETTSGNTGNAVA